MSSLGRVLGKASVGVEMGSHGRSEGNGNALCVFGLVVSEGWVVEGNECANASLELRRGGLDLK